MSGGLRVIYCVGGRHGEKICVWGGENGRSSAPDMSHSRCLVDFRMEMPGKQGVSTSRRDLGGEISRCFQHRQMAYAKVYRDEKKSKDGALGHL